MTRKKYSLWRIVHESVYTVNLEKYKDTNSTKECDKWMGKDCYNTASFFREENCINAKFVQCFEL